MKTDQILKKIIILAAISIVLINTPEIYNYLFLEADLRFKKRSVFLIVGILLYLDFERRLTYLYILSAIFFLYIFPFSYLYLIPYLVFEYLIYRFCIAEFNTLRNPKGKKLIFLHTLYTILLYTSINNENLFAYTGPKLFLFIFLYYVPSLWRYSYLIKEIHNGLKEYSFPNFLFFKISMWGGSATPFGKGLLFLNKIKVDNKEQLYTSFKAGVSLLCLYSIYNILRLTLIKIDLLSYVSTGGPIEVWIGILIDFILHHLDWFGTFHLVIGFLRIFGFNAPAATNKAFLSETFMNLWNRYYYYFKELLVEFFFYPSFFLFFKHNFKLRTAFATFMAAGVGNFYYHALSRTFFINSDAIRYIIYAIILASLISISQYRFLNGMHKTKNNLLIKLKNIFIVVTSFFFLWSFSHYGWDPFAKTLIMIT